MIVTGNRFHFVSLNINGTKDKDLLIDEHLDYDIVFLQEHFLTKANTDTLKRSPTLHTLVREAKKTCGRPSGVIATLVRLAKKPELISFDHNLRAIKCGNIVLINV